MALTSMGTTTWDPLEFELRAEQRYDNPYTDVVVRASFVHDTGEQYEVPGFWAGEDVWCVRFAPSRPGQWNWEVKNDGDDPGLEGNGKFHAHAYMGANPIKEHGFLRTASNDRHLVHDDGTPFFWLGDTIWTAPAKATVDEWKRYLTKRTAQGFNIAQMNSLPQWDTSQPIQRYPFKDHWNLDKPNPEYFNHLDELVAMAHDRGIFSAFIVLWFNFVPGTRPDDPPNSRHPFTKEQATRYGEYLAARYGPYGAIWLISGDSDFNEESYPIYEAAAEAIEESATHPLQTLHMHPSVETPEVANKIDWFDFHFYQSSHYFGEGKKLAFQHAENHRAMEPARPVINGEPVYEAWGYLDLEGEVKDLLVSRENARRAAWWSLLAGGNAGITYGASGMWHWFHQGERVFRTALPEPHPWEKALELPAADDYGSIKSFFSRFDFGSLEPRQDVLSSGEETVRVAEFPNDDVLIAYTPDRRSLTFDENVSLASAAWLDPASGRRHAATTDGRTVAPAPWTGDALLMCPQ